MTLKIPNTEDFPSSKKDLETYYIKGLNNYSTYNSLLDIFIKYIQQKENFLYFSSFSDNKIQLILELKENIKDKNIKIFFNNNFENAEKFILSEDYSNFDVLIFYDMKIPFVNVNYKKQQIIGFFNYSNILYLKLDNYFIDFTKEYPEDFIYSTICKKTKEKNIKFVFGTNEDAKLVCLLGYKNNYVYIKNENVINRIKNTKKIECKILDLEEKNSFISTLIFYDLNLDIFKLYFDRIDDFVFIYTHDDIDEIRKICVFLDEMNINVPEYIKSLIK